MAVDNVVESSRLEKLRNIEKLGLDPWGHRFDDHQAIQTILQLPSDVPEDQRPRVKAAGRIVSRRIGGKVHFLDLRDWSGQLTTRKTTSSSDEAKHAAAELTDWSSRIRVMVGQKQLGETGWGLAPEPDPGGPPRARRARGQRKRAQ